ncbi:MAG: hypothetical protein M1826_000815 [Phylliscum demangeonii]|nr:MAG: hypothetical protein M1826_000815 [Phylliscum demangeonii]
MSAVAELEAALQGMQALKPPGVSGTKVNTITALCAANVQFESVLVQKLYTHFKKTPGTHKLGVLYVVDNVTRQWIEHARKAGEPLGVPAGDGTYAAGINRVTELLPVLMSDIVQHAPENQKEKIRKLVDIWERGSTFPAAMVASFKEKLKAPSTAPPASTSAILAALADMAKQSANTPAPAPAPAPPNGIAPSNAPHLLGPAPLPLVTQAPPMAPMPGPPAGIPLAGVPFLSSFAGFPVNGAMPTMPQPAPAAILPPANGGGNTQALQQQVALIQLLIQQGIPQDQWATIMAAIGAGNQQANANANAVGSLGGAPAGWQNAGNAWGEHGDPSSRDRNGGRASPGGGRRDRSRSPWGRNRDASPPRRRDSPTYGEYHGGSPGRLDGRGDPFDRRGRGRAGRGRESEYRHRSPLGARRTGNTDSPPARPGGGAKWIEYDSTLGKDNIKVLSRTLFVGGVTTSEDELRAIFTRFGVVQTCIVNSDKRHAFVKMISRADALAAKEGMESHKPSDLQLRVGGLIAAPPIFARSRRRLQTRWGVGFGPRDCSDYQTGISIIPIVRLTDADRKWMLTADYGGSGGKPIEGGLVVEEPDIEIGAGVSSKAISRRMVTDLSGRTGPRSGRPTYPDHTRGRRNDRSDPAPGPDRDSVNAITVAPPASASTSASAYAAFPFLDLPQGMPVLPAGFVLPGSSAVPGAFPGPGSG